MDKLAAYLNIEYYRERLATEKDSTKQDLLERLLAKAEAELAVLLGQEKLRH